MNKYIDDYLSVFSQTSEYIKSEVNKCIEYWLPDSPPTILLFSLVGKALVNQLGSLSKLEKTTLFQHIETGMKSDNDELATAVATGLVESLITASDENESVWQEIESYLHVESKKHALAWKNFGQ
ncbi:hypothetical protein ACMVCI_004673 [Yersinia enterocolitica]|uniref:DUF7674 domain-containing protein n=1 Tax=Yersinia enterocolitica TaxID=630 RepID=A0A9P1LYG7_YEREN|nr:hypothetical protein [Yersinia enterocolitica]EKN3461736.1 hypothetical protein [Yersinia enterocolitica]EKN3514968.1 hypothetical protein [Yersinia enterocolitica]EKN3563166.1 hypothetical protein [Yersinia enterocolitica]EKN3601446.1 hypothetical protein [Yersinia enterocolitica]EKN3612555.1 hypothetical protein [Yersinia enterocolitica]